MSAWESTRTPSLRKSASCSIIALRNNSESPILSSSATVHSPSVDWSLLKEPHGGRLRQRPLPFTHSRGHYRVVCTSRPYALLRSPLCGTDDDRDAAPAKPSRYGRIDAQPNLLAEPHYLGERVEVDPAPIGELREGVDPTLDGARRDVEDSPASRLKGRDHSPQGTFDVPNVVQDADGESFIETLPESRPGRQPLQPSLHARQPLPIQALPRVTQHLRRSVHRDRPSAAACHRNGVIPRPAADLQHGMAALEYVTQEVVDSRLFSGPKRTTKGNAEKSLVKVRIPAGVIRPKPQRTAHLPNTLPLTPSGPVGISGVAGLWLT